MDVAIRDFWTGKTEAELAETMAMQERDFYRDPHSFGDGRNYNELQIGDFPWTPIKASMNERDTTESHDRIAEFFSKVKAWKETNRIKADLSDTLSAMVAFNDSEADTSERLTEFGRALGIRRNSAAKRIGTFNKHREALQRIAREVWDI